MEKKALEKLTLAAGQVARITKTKYTCLENPLTMGIRFKNAKKHLWLSKEWISDSPYYELYNKLLAEAMATLEASETIH